MKNPRRTDIYPNERLYEAISGLARDRKKSLSATVTEVLEEALFGKNTGEDLHHIRSKIDSLEAILDRQLLVSCRAVGYARNALIADKRAHADPKRHSTPIESAT